MDTRKLRKNDAEERGERHGQSARSRFSKWLLAAGAAAAIAGAMPSCGNPTLDNYIPIPPAGTTDGGSTSDGGAGGMDGGVSDGGSTDGGCTPQAPVCLAQHLNAPMTVGDPALIVGDYRVRLADTGESAGEQYASIEVLDSCMVHITTVDINENQTTTFAITSTDIEIDVNVTNVTVTDPKSARVDAVMRCTGEDGGPTTDAGTGGDGGSGGDGGMAGMDGSVSDGGSTADGGSGGDGGSAGMDGGVSDGGSTTDAGSGGDGGSAGMDGGSTTDAGSGGDGGMAGMDGGISDGGSTTDAGSGGDGGAGGMDGGISDGGVSDGGAGDAGPVCSGSPYAESVDHGNFPLGAWVGVGGYQIRYDEPVLGGVHLDIVCGGGGSVVTDEAFALNIQKTVLVPTDSMRIRITPVSKNAFHTIMNVDVESSP
jgi:hypothetical protein